MKHPQTFTHKVSPAWFSEWFNTSYYHQLYAHRNDEEAFDFITNMINQLQLKSTDQVLDVGCGNGRHCKQLARTCYATGIDLAPASIAEARKHAVPNTAFFVHDMRDPFGTAYYDMIGNFFTSFGYFDSYQQHIRVLRNMVQALKPGGKLVIDYINSNFSEKRLVPREDKEIAGVRYSINRWSDVTAFYKKIEINDPYEPVPLTFTEQVAKFSLDDFREMFQLSGVTLVQVFGNYALHPFEAEKSPRLIMIAQKD